MGDCSRLGAFKVGMLKMFWKLAVGLVLMAGSGAMAQNAHCDQLYEKILTQTTSDPDSCIPVLEPTRPFEQCYKPFDYFGDRQASHIVLILDASGSMAGKVNGKIFSYN